MERTYGGSTGHNPANPVVQGAGGETTWHQRSFKMNGKYGSCKYHTDPDYMVINPATTKLI